jgi:uncharacterized membrane protein
MTFVILGLFTFLISLATFVAAFFVGVASGLTALQVGIVMLVALFGMFQGAFIMGHVE